MSPENAAKEIERVVKTFGPGRSTSLLAIAIALLAIAEALTKKEVA